MTRAYNAKNAMQGTFFNAKQQNNNFIQQISRVQANSSSMPGEKANYYTYRNQRKTTKNETFTETTKKNIFTNSYETFNYVV